MPYWRSIAASVVILTAGYILWAIQRVYLGPEYKGPHGDALTPMTPREISIAATLVVCAIWFGVYPMAVLRYMDATIDKQVAALTQWTQEVKTPLLQTDPPSRPPLNSLALPEPDWESVAAVRAKRLASDK